MFTCGSKFGVGTNNTTDHRCYMFNAQNNVDLCERIGSKMVNLVGNFDVLILWDDIFAPFQISIPKIHFREAFYELPYFEPWYRGELS
jgi:hypothetical protein